MKLFNLFFSKNKTKEELALIRFIIKKFGYKPNDLQLFIQAITHKSLSYGEDLNSNERLEFLGDSILDAVVAEFLYHKFPEEDEGYLTKVKAKLVSRKTLGDIGEEMELRTILSYHKKRSINLATLEGNAFEAIIGAIYLDGGYEAVKKTVYNHILRNYVNLNKLLEEEIDFKSKLYIWSQKKHLNLEFTVLSEENLNGVWQYKILTTINEVHYGIGIGSTKKQAEQAASKETLELMGEI